MSINWVMTSPETEGFVKLPNERILYTSPPRTSLQITTPNNYPGAAAQPFTVKHDAGVVYITNQRIVFLPSNPTTELQSFSSPILNLQDTHVRAPFFGANYWTAVCKPVADGGIPPTHSAVELRLTFKEGGAFDFHAKFEEIKERLHQVYAMARENGAAGPDLRNVHLEQLPAYEPSQDGRREANADEPVIHSPRPMRPTEPPLARADNDTPSVPVNQVPPPDGPPPGYEETQAQALDQRLS